jgi:dTDP-4-amino-4,6-dideoxygalactose transaminase
VSAGARLAQLPPAISSLPLAELWRVARSREPVEQLCRQLARRLAARGISLHASGREALRAALLRAAQSTGRGEVLVPAYTCFSVAAACVAAGLGVRLIDLDAHGHALADALPERDWRGAAACLVDNLFGLPSPLHALAARARGAGTWLIDDAAQALGAVSPEGSVGSRGDVGLLSFGRGKPLSGLGGGALAWLSLEPGSSPALPSPAPLRAGLRRLAYALASTRPAFGLLASIPALEIGESVYDPDFARGGIDGASALLALAGLADLDASAARRRARAHSIAARLAERGSAFEPLLEREGCAGVFPRLALLAPDARRRDAALERLRVCGATPMYPTPLGAIPRLAPHLVGDARCPGAADFCARLLTLPTHARVGEASVEQMLDALR